MLLFIIFLIILIRYDNDNELRRDFNCALFFFIEVLYHIFMILRIFNIFNIFFNCDNGNESENFNS